MTRRIVIGILVALALVAGAVTIGVYAYQFGVMQGLNSSGQLVVPEGAPGPGPYFYHGMPYHVGPWGWGGFGFGLLRCLFPLLGLFLLFALARGLFWRGGWGGRGWGGPRTWDREHGTPPMFDEWHRRAHSGESGQAPPGEAGK